MVASLFSQFTINNKVSLTLNAATDTVTAKGYSGVPEGLFTSAISPKFLYSVTDVLAKQNYLFRTQTEASSVNVPDADGGDVGKGFTVTGLADGGTYWIVGSDGTNKETATPQVHLGGVVFVDKITNLNLGNQIRVDTLFGISTTTASVQGVALDPLDNSLWLGIGSNGVKHVTQAGAILSGAFVPAAGNANGVGLDTKRGYLLIFHYVSGTNSQLERYTRAGALIDTTTIPNTPDGDHAWYDAARDYYWFSYGPNAGTVNGAVAYRASDLSLVGTTIFPTAQAIEGIVISNGQFVICHDGYFHGWTSGALPALNQLQTYPAALGKSDVNWAKDYHPTTNALLGYRFESAYSRLTGFPISQGNVAWGKTSVSVTTLTQVSPTGATDANTVTATAATSVHELTKGASTSVTAGSKVVTSVMLKAGTQRYVWVGNRGDAVIRSATFDLTGSVVGQSNCVASIQNLGNGWYRCIQTYTATNTHAAGANLAFISGSAHALDHASFAAAGTETFHVYDYEIGLGDFPTTPVFGSSSAPEARAADAASLAITAWDFGATVNTFTLEGTTAPGTGSANQIAFQLDDGSESNRYRLVRDTSNVLRFIVSVSGSDVVNLNLGTVANSTSFKVAVRASANDFAASLNGATCVTSASGALPTVTTLRPGMSFTGEQWNGAVKAFSAIPSNKSNATLQTLST